VQIKNW